MIFKEIYKANIHAKDNKKFLNMISYYLSLRDYGTVKKLINNVSQFTKDVDLISRMNGLFINDKRAKENFGIADIIISAMSTAVFGGNVTFKSTNEEVQKKLNDLYEDGYYMRSVIEAYKTAIATNGAAYIFYDVTPIYDTSTEEKVKDKFLKYTIEPEFNLEIKNNSVSRVLVKEYKGEFYTFKYTYNVIDTDNVMLSVQGYNEKDERIPFSQTQEILEIDNEFEHFNFIPYERLDLGSGMLPNILWIENSLTENLYFQDEDLVNSQTRIYLPDDQLQDYYINKEEVTKSFDDKYSLTKVVKGGSIDSRENLALVVEGKSAISSIERNLALNVMQACLDAGISPVSINYSVVDRMSNNTDVGSDKERVTIRLRESHIDRLKIFMAKTQKKFLYLDGISVELEELSIIFDQYITPSVESLTNTLAKQVQFGLKSNKRGAMELSRGELTKEELDEEIEEIKVFSTQRDFNVAQRGVDNVLKSEGIVE